MAPQPRYIGEIVLEYLLNGTTNAATNDMPQPKHRELSTKEEVMKPQLRITLPITLLLLLASVSPMNASVSSEIKVRGTVKGIETTGTIGMHILLRTAQGAVEADLGYEPAETPRNIDFSLNDTVEVIGVMRKTGERDVLLARILTTSNQVFILRNERGIPRSRISGTETQRKRVHPQQSTPRYLPPTAGPQSESYA